MASSPRTQRTVLRWVHIAVGSLLAAYVYWPVGQAGALRGFLMFAGVPVVSATGIWMWQQAAIRRRLLTRRSGRPVAVVASSPRP